MVHLRAGTLIEGEDQQCCHGADRVQLCFPKYYTVALNEGREQEEPWEHRIVNIEDGLNN